jgi:hypothetical protein
VAAWYGALLMSQFKWFICPRTDLSIWQPMPCAEVPDTFRPHTFRLADLLVSAGLGCCGGPAPLLMAAWTARSTLPAICMRARVPPPPHTHERTHTRLPPSEATNSRTTPPPPPPPPRNHHPCVRLSWPPFARTTPIPPSTTWSTKLGGCCLAASAPRSQATPSPACPCSCTR